MLLDVDVAGDVARSETYTVAFHRYTDPDGHPTDMWAFAEGYVRGLRSPDDVVFRILDQ